MDRGKKLTLLWIAVAAIAMFCMISLTGHYPEYGDVFLLAFALIVIVPALLLFFYGVRSGRLEKTYSNVGFGRLTYNLYGAMAITFGAGFFFSCAYMDSFENALIIGTIVMGILVIVGAVLILISYRKEEYQGQLHAPGLLFGFSTGLMMTGVISMVLQTLSDDPYSNFIFTIAPILAGVILLIYADAKWKLTRNSLFGHIVWGEPKE